MSATPEQRAAITGPHRKTPICDARVGADIIGEAATADEALRIIRERFIAHGIHIPRVKLAQVSLARAEQPRHVVAWIPAD